MYRQLSYWQIHAVTMPHAFSKSRRKLPINEDEIEAFYPAFAAWNDI